MSTPVLDIIEAAWSRSTAFNPGKLAQDAEVLAHLNRKFQNLFARWAVRAGDKANAQTWLTWTGMPAVTDLPAEQVDIIRLETSDGQEITLLPAREQGRIWHLAPACYQVGAQLRSRGAIAYVYGYQRDPAQGDVSTMFHKSAPPPITSLDDTLDARFPIRHELGLVLDLAVMLATKQEGIAPGTLQALTAELTREEATFAYLIGETTSAREAAHVGKVPASEKAG
jgi:hypothetical protein